jgi:hypothetical protein
MRPRDDRDAGNVPRQPALEEDHMSGKSRKGGSSGSQQTGQNNKGKGKGK